MAPESLSAVSTLKLPPLILHPFADSTTPNKLMAGSRANLMLQGILPNENLSSVELKEILLESRVCEIRMLYYVGKDLLRWIEQCVETVSTEDAWRGSAIEPQTFALVLIEHAPPAVEEKLRLWGVQDYRSIFARAIGLNTVFGDAPSREILAPEFIRNYDEYADQLYATWQHSTAHERPGKDSFTFELYASAEYSRMLERQWTEN